MKDFVYPCNQIMQTMWFSELFVSRDGLQFYLERYFYFLSPVNLVLLHLQVTMKNEVFINEVHADYDL